VTSASMVSCKVCCVIRLSFFWSVLNGEAWWSLQTFAYPWAILPWALIYVLPLWGLWRWLDTAAGFWHAVNLAMTPWLKHE
jgi:hypothetical protein